MSGGLASETEFGERLGKDMGADPLYALDSQARRNILQGLELREKASFAELEEMTGLKGNALQHHLRILIRAELLVNRQQADYSTARRSFYELTSRGREALEILKSFKYIASYEKDSSRE